MDLDSPQGDLADFTPRKPWWFWAFGAAGVLFLILLVSSSGFVWDGSVHRNISVRVTDNSTGYPVSGATVSLILPREEELLETMTPADRIELLQRLRHFLTTDKNGEALLGADFGAGGGYSLFGEHGKFGIDGMLKISHPDYRPSEDLLQNRLGEQQFSLGTKQLDVRVFLIPHRDPLNPGRNNQ